MFNTVLRAFMSSSVKQPQTAPPECIPLKRNFCKEVVNKTSRDCKTLPIVHLIGCQGVKLFLPKDFLKFGQELSIVRNKTLSEFKIYEFHKHLSYCVLSQFKFLSFATIIFFEFCLIS